MTLDEKINLVKQKMDGNVKQSNASQPVQQVTNPTLDDKINYIKQQQGQKSVETSPINVAPTYEETMQNYSNLASNNDFLTNSQVGVAPKTNFWNNNKNLNTFNVINNLGGQREALKNMYTIQGGEEKYDWLAKYEQMNQDEVNIYNYLYNTKSVEDAQKYLDYLTPTLNERLTNQKLGSVDKLTNGQLVGQNLIAPAKLIQAPIGALDLGIQGIKQQLYEQTGQTPIPIDYNAPNMYASNYRNKLRETTTEAIDSPFWKFAYGIGSSMLDSAVVMGLTAIGMPFATTLLGSDVAIQSGKEAKARGLSDEEALFVGIGSGIFEALFEELSLDKFFSLKDTTTKKKMVKNFIQQAFTEGSEEVNTSLANAILDDLVNHDKSEYTLLVKKYQNGEIDGRLYSYEEAKELAKKDFIKSLGMDFLGGAVSGGLFGMFGTAMNEVKAINRGSQIVNEGTQQAVIDDANNLGGKNADLVKDLNAEDTSLSAKRKLGYAERNNEQEKVYQEVKKSADEKNLEYTEKQLRALQKEAVGDELTPQDKYRLNKFEKANVDFTETENYNLDQKIAKVRERLETQQKQYATSDKTWDRLTKGKEIELTAEQQNAVDVVMKNVYGEGYQRSAKELILTQAKKWAKEDALKYDSAKQLIKNENLLNNLSNRGVDVSFSELAFKGSNSVGFYDADANKIFLNPKASSKDVLRFVASHELVHRAKAKSPNAFTKIEDAFKKEIGYTGAVEFNADHSLKTTDAEVVKAIEERKQQPIYRKMEISDEVAWEEAIAHWVEKLYTKTDSTNEIFRNETSFNKFVNSIVEKSNAMLGKTLTEQQQRKNVSQALKESVDKYSTKENKFAVKDNRIIDKQNGDEEIYSENLKMSSTLAEANINYDKETESANPLMFSDTTWRASDYVTNREKVAEELADVLNISKKKALDYIDSINSIANMIATDRVRLDYDASEGVSAFVSNSEYGGSIDFSTICKKRRLFTGTFEAIQNALVNTPLSSDEILEIRNMMKAKGYEVSCGLCYVEGSRTNMGELAKNFIERYKRENPSYLPTIADVTTPNGQENLRLHHKEAYDRLTYFMNNKGKLRDSDEALFSSQAKPKMYQLSTEYKDEILKSFSKNRKVTNGKNKGKRVVDVKNENGGLRIQSFSDFEIIHLIDMMQVIMDMSRVGLGGQAYTKVPNFAWALGDTGLKINLSMIAKGVDANGKIIFDEVEGMKWKDAEALRNRYSDNVGTILVVFNDAQLKSALADDRIDYIIPFHRSQWNKGQYDAMGLPANTKDYTPYQNESYIKPVLNSKGEATRPKNLMPNTYWDFKKSGKQNAERYLEICKLTNRKPKFSHLLVDNKDGSYSLQKDGSTDGYWKLLIDFKMYNNNGIGVPQNAVVPNFNMEEATRMLNEYEGGHQTFPVAKDVVKEFLAKKNVKASDTEIATDISSLTNGKADVGVYINDSGIKYTDLIFDGKLVNGKIKKKTIETRPTDSLKPLFKDADTRRVAIIRSGVGSPQIVGYATLHKGFKYETETEFDKDNKKHFVPSRNDEEKYPKSIEKYQWNGSKYGYEITDVERTNPIDVPKATHPSAYRYSDTEIDSKYMDAVENDDMETAQKLVEEYAKKKGYTIKAYHHTENLFTKFDLNKARKSMDIQGFYFSASPTAEEEYGSIKYNVLLKIEHPYIVDSNESAKKIPFDLSKQNSGAVARQWLLDNGYDSVIRKADYMGSEVDEYIVLNPNQIKLADELTFDSFDDNGNVIPLSERFQDKNDDIRYSDTEISNIDSAYMDAVNNNDTEKQAELVRTMARAKGYNSPLLYHATNNFGFTKFNTDFGTIFATDNEEVSSTYTLRNKSVRRLSNDNANLFKHYEADLRDDVGALAGEFISKSNNKKFEVNDDELYEAIKHWVLRGEDDENLLVIRKAIADVVLTHYGSKISRDDVKSIADWFDETDGAYELYDTLYDKVYDLVDSYQKVMQIGGIYQLYGKLENPLVIDCQGNNWDNLGWDNVLVETLGSDVNELNHWDNGYATTDSILKWIKKHYDGVIDGVIFKNIVDVNNGEDIKSNVYTFFNANQVKSADEVTYDDNGKVIPLSERFNDSNNDIRWSDSTFNANSGYDGYSMSNRAREAYENGEMPLSKWTKEEILNKVMELNPSLLDDIKGFNAETLKKNLLKWSSWHHTSKYYNPTAFYSINENYLENLTKDEIKDWEIVKSAKPNIDSKDITSRADEIYTKLQVIFSSPNNNYKTFNGLFRAYRDGKIDIDKLYAQSMEDIISNIKENDSSRIAQWEKLPDGHWRKEYIDMFNNNIEKYIAKEYGIKFIEYADDIPRREKEYQQIKSLLQNNDIRYSDTEIEEDAEIDRILSELGDIEFLEEDLNVFAPRFYSKLQQEVENFKGKKVDVGSFENYLKGKGVKEEEIKWSGIRTFFDGKKSVDKIELIQFLKDNQIKFEEKVLEGSDTNWSNHITRGGSNYREKLYILPNSDYTNKAMRTHWKGNKGVVAHARIQDFKSSYGEDVLFIDEIQSDWHNEIQKYGTTKTHDAMVKKIQDKIDDLNKKIENTRDRYDSKVADRLAGKLYEAFQNKFKESARRLASFDELTDKELYNNTLEEFQKSCPSQFTTKNDYVRYILGDYLTLDTDDGYGYFKDKNQKLANDIKKVEDIVKEYLTEEEQAEIKRIHELRREQDDLFEKIAIQEKKLSELEKNDGAEYDAPFTKYTDFVLKNLIRDASEQGYDYLAWTTGEMQEDRWDSEFAEGYRIEYDQDIPNFLNKFGKQFDAKVDTIMIPVPPNITNSNTNYHTEVDRFGNVWHRLFDAKTGEELYSRLGSESFNFSDVGNGVTRNSALGSTTTFDRASETYSNYGMQDILINLYLNYVAPYYSAYVPAIKITEEMKDSVIYKGQPLFSDTKLDMSDETWGELNDKFNNPTRKFAYTSMNAFDDKAFKSKVQQAIMDEVMSYKVVSDEEATKYANDVLAEKGFKDALKIFKNDIANDKVEKKTMVLGERLMLEASVNKDYDTMLDICTDLAVEGTRSGQVIQAMSLVKKAGAEGQVMTLNKLVKTLNKERQYKDKEAKKLDERRIKLEQQKTNLESQINPLTSRINTLNEQIKKLQEERNNLAKEQKSNINDVIKKQSRIRKLSTDIQNLLNDVDNTKSKLKVLSTEEQQLKDIKKELANIKKNLEPYQIKLTAEVVADIMNSTTRRELDEAVQNAYMDIAKQMPPTLLDKWNAWRYMSMLANPTTHIRNIVGNAMFIPAMEMKNLIKVGLEHTIGKAYDLDARTTASFLTKEDKAEAIAVYNDKAKYLMSSGKYNPSNAINENRTIFKTKVLEYIRKKNGDVLETEDAIFLKRAFVEAYSRYIKANPNADRQKAFEYARDESWKATYRDASQLADAMNKFANSNKVANVLTNAILPFKKTPINILKRGIEYSPVYVVKSVYDMLFSIRKGKLTPSQALDELASGLSGTLIALLGWLLSKWGILNGAGNDDTRAYEQQVNGYQDFSANVNIPFFNMNGTYTLDWASPSSMPMFFGVALEEMMQNQFSIREFAESFLALGEPMLEMSVLSSLTSILTAGKYAESTSDVIGNIASQMVTSYLGQAVPTFFRKVANIYDSNTRNTSYNDKTSQWIKPAQTFGRQVVNKIPVASTSLEPKIDVWGREMSSGGSVERHLESLVSVGYYSGIKTTKVDEEIMRLYNKTLDVSVVPKTSFDKKYASKDADGNAINIDMDINEYTAYARLKGQTQYNCINQLMSTKYYNALSDDEKVSAISDMYSWARWYALKQTFGDKFTTDTYAKQYKLISNLGIPYSQYYSLMSAYNDAVDEREFVVKANGDKEYKQSQSAILTKMLRNSGLNPYQCQQIFKSRFPNNKSVPSFR